MSRLQTYLNEDISEIEIIKTIEDDCKSFLRELGKFRPLFRGSFSKTINDIEKVVPRTDRKPRNTPLSLHKELDKIFLKKFGWGARSEGVFTTPVVYDAQYYGRSGRTYLFFPIGKYQYVWSSKYADFTADVNAKVFRYYEDIDTNNILGSLKEIWVRDINTEEDFDDWVEINKDKIREEMLEKVEEIVSTYRKTGLNKAISKRVEIAFKCKSYYLVNMKFLEYFNESTTNIPK